MQWCIFHGSLTGRERLIDIEFDLASKLIAV